MTERAPGVWRLRVMTSQGQIERTFRGGQTPARRALSELVGEQPATSETPGRTFEQLLDKWITHLEARGRAPKTLDENRREIKTRIKPRLGAIVVSELTAEHLDDAYSAWLTEGLSASTVHRHAAVISAALTQGVKWGWLEASPASKASAPAPAATHKLITPGPEQVTKLIRAAEEFDPIMATAIAIAFITGGRRGELAALRWSDVNLEAGTIRIERSLSQVGRDLIEKSTKTGRGRTVALDERAVALLRRHQAWQLDLSKRAESPLVTDPYVLSKNANGARPIEPSKITDRFVSVRGRAHIRDVRFHDLRHAHVTQLLSAGVDATTVAARVGHASTRMTLDRYAHALPAGDVAAAAVIGALLPEQ
ncbi:MAG: tyrosine-type recombinase/integrase [Acidimicrobiales bacterium]